MGGSVGEGSTVGGSVAVGSTVGSSVTVGGTIVVGGTTVVGTGVLVEGIGVLVGGREVWVGGTRVEVDVGLGRRVTVDVIRIRVGTAEEVNVGEAGMAVARSVGVESILTDTACTVSAETVFRF